MHRVILGTIIALGSNTVVTLIVKYRNSVAILGVLVMVGGILTGCFKLPRFEPVPESKEAFEQMLQGDFVDALLNTCFPYESGAKPDVRVADAIRIKKWIASEYERRNWGEYTYVEFRPALHRSARELIESAAACLDELKHKRFAKQLRSNRRRELGGSDSRAWEHASVEELLRAGLRAIDAVEGSARANTFLKQLYERTIRMEVDPYAVLRFEPGGGLKSPVVALAASVQQVTLLDKMLVWSFRWGDGADVLGIENTLARMSDPKARPEVRGIFLDLRSAAGGTDLFGKQMAEHFRHAFSGYPVLIAVDRLTQGSAEEFASQWSGHESVQVVGARTSGYRADGKTCESEISSSRKKFTRFFVAYACGTGRDPVIPDAHAEALDDSRLRSFMQNWFDRF